MEQGVRDGRLRTAWGVTGALFIGFAAFVLLGYSTLGKVVGAFSAVPVYTGGWLLGPRVGLIAGLFSIPLSSLLHWLLGHDVLRELYSGMPGHVLAVVGGFATGWVSSQRHRVERILRMEQERTEIALHESEERFHAAFHQAAIGMAILTVERRFLQVNEALCDMLGYSPGELMSHDPWELLHPEEHAARGAGLSALLNGQEFRHIAEHRLQPRAGHYIWAELATSLVRGSHGEPLYYLVQIQDITRRKQAEAELVRHANEDPLTGLANRRRFREQLASAAESGAGAVIFFDIDGFKYVNDSLGHQTGDEVLEQVGALLARLVETNGLTSRLGGDEFAVLLPGAGRAQARTRAEQIRTALGQTQIAAGSSLIRLTGSLGIALFPEHGTQPDELLARADLAMYQAKENGRDCVCIFSPYQSVGSELEGKLTWERRIQEALAENRMKLYAQPVFDLRTGRPDHYELLLRMRTEEGELVPPAEFLPVAERFGLIRSIDRWALDEALGLLRRLQEKGLARPLALKLSGKSLHDDVTLSEIVDQVSRSGVDPALLIFAVAESIALGDPNRVRGAMERLTALGCRIAIANFGAGFSSFRTLRMLPMHHLKIDASFILPLAQSEADQHLVRSVVELSRGLGVKTIADGIGCNTGLALVREYGIDYAQSDHLGRPHPAEALLWPIETSVF